MKKKIYCSISNHQLVKDVSSDKLNYLTYLKLLEYFDEVHIYGRTFKNANYIKKDEYHSIYMHYISAPKYFLFKYIVTIIKMFFSILKDNKKYNFSIFDASEPTTGGMIACLLQLFIKKPFLLQVQGELTRISAKNEGFMRASLTKYITLLAIKYATKVRVVSDIVGKQLLDDGVSSSKIELLYARVNLEVFDYKLYGDINLNKEFNIPKNKKIFVYVGRLVEGKGLKYLIEALNLIDKNKFHLLVIGAGPIKNELIKLTKKLNLQKNITFVGKVEFTKVPYFMSKADFFILPTLSEGFGRVILESMAMKTLVLSSKVGGIQDILVDKITGFFFTAGDVSSIASVVNNALLLNAKEIELITEKSYNIVCKNYEFNNSMNKFIKLYDRTILEYENT